MKSGKRSRQQTGHSILEFGLIVIPTVYLLLGVVVIGINLGRAVQVAQICRDADSLFVRGAAVYTSSAQSFIAQLGAGMNLQTSGGDGLVTLSKVQFIPDASCGSPGSSGYANCTVGQTRLLQRIVFGDTTLPGTQYPTHGTVTYDSLDQVNNYLTDPNAVIDNFATLAFQLKPNEVSYIAEAHFRNSLSNLNVWTGTSPGIYSQAFF
ncbi:MAG TPA: hypothetical protein VKX49_04150 [Bryobacteraceae bacterium]|nr:hypothetical protein [Bryobacteraceae bacterium]